VRVVRDPEALRRIDADRLTVTVGNFDGVHRGHRAVLAELRQRAASRGTPAVVVTFEPHPLDVILARERQPLLSPGEERTELIAGEGADLLLVIDFTTRIARLSAEAFLRLISVGDGAHLVLGYDFHMGAGRTGDINRLGALGRAIGFGLDVVPPVRFEGRPISSSRIREELAAGDVIPAAEMLGRSYLLRGEIVPGAGKGRELGFPTLNLKLPERKLLPSDGVYLAAVSSTEGPERAGLLYVGRRPTLPDSDERRAEVHLPGGPPERTDVVSTGVLNRIRGDRAFSSKDELSEAIAGDVRTARRMLAEGPEPWRRISF